MNKDEKKQILMTAKSADSPMCRRFNLQTIEFMSAMNKYSLRLRRPCNHWRYLCKRDPKLKTHFDFHVLESDKIPGSHLFDTSLASCLSGSQAFTFSVVFRVV